MDRRAILERMNKLEGYRCHFEKLDLFIYVYELLERLYECGIEPPNPISFVVNQLILIICLLLHIQFIYRISLY